jgi:hypothetical protein
MGAGQHTDTLQVFRANKSPPSGGLETSLVALPGIEPGF